MKLVCLLSPVWQQSTVPIGGTEVDPDLADWLPGKQRFSLATWKPFTSTAHGLRALQLHTYFCICIQAGVLQAKLPENFVAAKQKSRHLHASLSWSSQFGLRLVSRPFSKKVLGEFALIAPCGITFCRYCHFHCSDFVVSLGSETQARQKNSQDKNLLKPSVGWVGLSLLLRFFGFRLDLEHSHAQKYSEVM